MNEKYLMATIRIPVKISLDGELTLLNEYSKIEIEKMNEETEMLLTKTTDTIYSKVIEYLGMYIQVKNTSIILEEEDKEEEDKEEMYEFPYMKKSKKPLNRTFRARFKSQNFTKKVYSD